MPVSVRPFNLHKKRGYAVARVGVIDDMATAGDGGEQRANSTDKLLGDLTMPPVGKRCAGEAPKRRHVTRCGEECLPRRNLHAWNSKKSSSIFYVSAARISPRCIEQKTSMQNSLALAVLLHLGCRTV